MTQRHKDLARSLSTALAAQGIKLKHAHALHAVAAMHGLDNWNQLAARPQTPLLEQTEAMQRLRERLTLYGLQNVHLTVWIQEGKLRKFLVDEQANVGNIDIGNFLQERRSIHPTHSEDEVDEYQGKMFPIRLDDSQLPIEDFSDLARKMRQHQPVSFELLQNASPLVITSISPEGKTYFTAEDFTELQPQPKEKGTFKPGITPS